MVEPAPAPPPRLGARGTATMAGLLLATLGATLPQATTAPVVGLTAEAYGTTAAESSWALTIVPIVAVATTPLIGRLGDAYGARRVLRMLLPIVALGLVVAALAPTIGWLIAGRAVQGLGGGVFPLAITIASHIVPDRHRAAAVGLITAMFATGIGFGALISGLLVDNIGIRALSWVPFAVLAVAEVILLVTLTHIPRRGGVHLDWWAALALSTGVVAILVAVTEAPRWPMPVVWVAACTLIGIGALVWWFRRERRSPDPLIGAAALQQRSVWATHLTAVLLGAALLGSFMLLPLYAEAPAAPREGLGASVTLAGLLLLPATVAMIAVGPLSGVLRRWIGTRAPVILGAGIAAGGAIMLLASPRDLGNVVVGTVLLGAGIAISSAGMINVLVDVDPGRVGANTAVNVVARQLGGAVGVAVVAAAVVAGSTSLDDLNFGAGFTAVVVMTAGGVGAALLIPKAPGSRQTP